MEAIWSILPYDKQQKNGEYQLGEFRFFVLRIVYLELFVLAIRGRYHQMQRNLPTQGLKAEDTLKKYINKTRDEEVNEDLFSD